MQFSKSKLIKVRGFTLLELLVVVSIVAFLATISLVALGVAQAKARDSKRQVDAFTIIKAAELHYSDNGFYPAYWIGLGALQAETPLVMNESIWGKLIGKFVPVSQAKTLNVEDIGDGGGGGGGPCPKYNVCNGNFCNGQYTGCLGPPSGGLCTSDSDCKPAVTHDQLFVRDDCVTSGGSSCWLAGLDPYLSLIPIDPGSHKISEYDHYYISSHPEIVKNHGLCFFWSFENEGNSLETDQYDDITAADAPLKNDPNWSTLCVR